MATCDHAVLCVFCKADQSRESLHVLMGLGPICEHCNDVLTVYLQLLDELLAGQRAAE